MILLFETPCSGPFSCPKFDPGDWRILKLVQQTVLSWPWPCYGNNIPHPVIDQLLPKIAKRTVMKNNHKQNWLKSTTAQ